MKINKLIYLFSLFVFISCEPEIDDINFNGGTADFTRTVAVGNSLTAGFQSSALRRDKQMVSFPAIISQQLQMVGGGEFTQPLLDDGVGIGSTLNAELGLFLKADCLGEVGPSPDNIDTIGQVDQFNFLDQTNFIGGLGPYNNVGVPGAKSFHLTFPGYGNPAGLLTQPMTANPFFVRFVDPLNMNETVIQTAMRADPTFFSLWIGNNDVLLYALGGGDEGNESITPVPVFQASFIDALDSLTKNGAKGVVANIPDIASIPHFTTIKWNALELTAEQAAGLNGAFAAYNQALQGNAALSVITQEEADRRTLSFKEGVNGFVIFDSDLNQILDSMGMPIQESNMRQMVEGELLTLTTPGDAIRCEGFGSLNLSVNPPEANPITGNYVLDAEEVASIENTIDAYNEIIKSEAKSRGLAFVNENSRLRELADVGITINGIDFSAAFISGGAFSLDGIHPSTRGYAIIANDFIKAINRTYNAKIPRVDVGNYPAMEVAL